MVNVLGIRKCLINMIAAMVFLIISLLSLFSKSIVLLSGGGGELSSSEF